jgi:hypothetical protein
MVVQYRKWDELQDNRETFLLPVTMMVYPYKGNYLISVVHSLT